MSGDNCLYIYKSKTYLSRRDFNHTSNLNLVELTNILTDRSYYLASADSPEFGNVAGTLIRQAWHTDDWVAVLNSDNAKQSDSVMIKKSWFP